MKGKYWPCFKMIYKKYLSSSLLIYTLIIRKLLCTIELAKITAF